MTLIFGLIMFVGSSITPVYAAQNGPTRISLEDLGLLQLAAHDLFNVNRATEVNLENGKFDLSTVLDHGSAGIASGGERRNSENVMVFTVAKRFGDQYLALTGKGLSAEQARKVVVTSFNAELHGSFARLLKGPLPSKKEGAVTFTEDLAFRTVHDLLPGSIKVNGVSKSVFDSSLRGVTLSKKDLKQLGAPLDGQFDPALRAIVFGPFTLDLLERDSSFATQFNTDFSFEYFLSEVADGRFDSNDKVTGYIRDLFAKGLTN